METVELAATLSLRKVTLVLQTEISWRCGEHVELLLHAMCSPPLYQFLQFLCNQSATQLTLKFVLHKWKLEQDSVLLQFRVTFNKRFASLTVSCFCFSFIFSFFLIDAFISMGTTVSNKHLQVKIKFSTDTVVVYFVFVMISFMNLYMVSYFMKIVSRIFCNSMAFSSMNTRVKMPVG